MALPKLETPNYTVEIPSSGEKVEYRPFTVKEQKQLLIAKESNDQEAMIRTTRDLIESCVYDVKVKDLTLFDFEYLFVKIRAKSVGETSDVRIACEECGEQSPVTLDLEKTRVEGDLKKNRAIELTSEIGIVMRWPSFESALNLINTEKSNAEIAADAIIDCIESVYDQSQVYPAEDVPKKELEEFVDSMTAAQFQKVAEFFEESPKVVLATRFTCQSCKHKNKLEIEGMKNFF